MDRYEVTNSRYARCVAAGKCQSVRLVSSNLRAHYFDDQRFADYPVVFVDHAMASAFCAFEGGRLPTEAEYVARYCARTGRAAIGDWDYYLAYNFFRMAAIVQGIRKRAEQGTAAAANALEFGRGARLLADMGWERARRAGAG